MTPSAPAPDFTACPELRTGAVHIWRSHVGWLTAAAPDAVGGLSEDERERAGRFVFERDRRAFVASRTLLRRLLGRYLGILPGEVRFEHGPHGKPVVAGGVRGRLHFSLSRSQDVLLIGVSGEAPLGVDVEVIRRIPERDGIAGRFFAAAESERLALLPEAHRDAAFFACWTRKEAFVKATGEGLSCPLDQFEVTLGPSEVPRVVHVRGDGHEAARWTLANLAVGPGCAAALAIRTRGTAVVCCGWDGGAALPAASRAGCRPATHER